MTVDCPKCISNSGEIYPGAARAQMEELDDRYVCRTCGCVVIKAQKRHVKN